MLVFFLYSVAYSGGREARWEHKHKYFQAAPIDEWSLKQICFSFGYSALFLYIKLCNTG